MWLAWSGVAWRSLQAAPCIGGGVGRCRLPERIRLISERKINALRYVGKRRRPASSSLLIVGTCRGGHRGNLGDGHGWRLRCAGVTVQRVL